MHGERGEDGLALKAAAGNRAALEALLESYYQRIYRMAWRWCGTVEEAEDVAQDVCVKLASGIRGYRGQSAFATWVWRITYNASIDRVRADSRTRFAPPDEIMALIDAPCNRTGASPETEAQDRELWNEVRGLPAQQRDAVLLVYAEDMSHAEAATVMGVSEKTVSWHLHAARKTLKSRLEAAE